MNHQLLIPQPLPPDLIIFQKPVRMVYRHDINQYELGKGWLHENVEVDVIGEDSELYVTHLTKSELGYWVDNHRWSEYSIIPIGFHKSRLSSEKPKAHQLSLFSPSANTNITQQPIL